MMIKADQSLTDLSMVDVVENLADVVEESADHCLSISAVPHSLSYSCRRISSSISKSSRRNDSSLL